MDVQGPNTQDYVEQMSIYSSDAEKWKIERLSDGYYTLQSEYGAKKYIGISGSSIGENNVKLFSSVSNYTKWKIFVDPDGDLIIESKMYTGRVLSVPSNDIAENLQLEWMSSVVDNRNRWIIEYSSETPLEGQRWSNWCWVTSARMLAKHYYPSVTRTQDEAVAHVYGYVINRGGWEDQAIDAANFYIGNISGSSLNLQYAKSSSHSSSRRYSEENLKCFLDDNNPVFITRSWYSGSDRIGGHCTIIIGYTTFFKNGSIVYRYMVNDPYPETEPDPWNTPTITTGQTYYRSYQWICNGRDVQEGDVPDSGIWEGYVTTITSYSSDTLLPNWHY